MARQLVAFDVLGSGLGERVLVATGSVASNWFAHEHPPIDALIIGSLDSSCRARAARAEADDKADHEQGDMT